MTVYVGENLSRYVQRVMQEKGLSRSDVARNSGDEIAGSYVGRIVNGTVTNLSVEKIVALARGLDVDPFEIFAASVDKPPRDTRGQATVDLVTVDLAQFGYMIQKLATNADLLEILQMCLNMSDKNRRSLLRTLRYMNKSRQKSSKKKKS